MTHFSKLLVFIIILSNGHTARSHTAFGLFALVPQSMEGAAEPPVDFAHGTANRVPGPAGRGPALIVAY